MCKKVIYEQAYLTRTARQIGLVEGYNDTTSSSSSEEGKSVRYACKGAPDWQIKQWLTG